MSRIGIIGGSGFAGLQNFELLEAVDVDTPYGATSAPLQHGRFDHSEIVFLPRHGVAHTIPPHLINYRANLWALGQSGVQLVIALAAVGGIDSRCTPGSVVVPDQIIDYTYGREHTYSDRRDRQVEHIEFTDPYCPELRAAMIAAARDQGVAVIESGTYAATQGPRLESAAEINRLEREGASIVGMTGMPEAALARELGLCYATLAMVVNAAAGKSDAPIDGAGIDQAFSSASQKAYRILSALLPGVADLSFTLPEPVRA